MGSLLLVARQGAQETWTLNDAATRNALSDALVQALPAAQEHLLSQLSLAAPQAMAATKQLLAASSSHDLPAVLDQATMAFAQGLRAFARKAKPGWAL